MSYRGKHDSGLHNCTISSYYVQAARTESQYNRHFGSNSFLFTPFKTCDIYKCLLLKCIFKLIHKQLPHYFKQFTFTFRNQQHNYATRTCHNVSIPNVIHEFAKRSIRFIAPSAYNSTLSALNTKMDNLLSNQAAFESKLEAIERRVTSNTTVTTELSSATEFNANTIKDQQTVIDSLQKSLAALAQDNVSMSSSLNTLNAKSSRSERHSRSFNVRFLGVPEQDGENCMKLAEKLLFDKFHVGGSPIENAHRTGKAVQGHPRQVIALFYSRVTRMDVLRTARAKLSATKIRIVDDLTQEDLREKNRVRPFMDELYKLQQRPSFRNGRLYADGKEVALYVINAFLNHSGPV